MACASFAVIAGRRDGSQLIVIGVDSHKATHAVAAVDCATGRVVGETTVAATSPGIRALIRWARQRSGGDEIAFAVEDNRRLTHHLEIALLRRRDRVLRVPPRLTARRRGRDRERGKSDTIDARSVARVAIEQGLDRLASATVDPDVEEIRVLVGYRLSLVRERVRWQNRLRWLVLDLAPAREATIPHRRPLGTAMRQALMHDLVELPGVQADVAARQLRRIRDLTVEIKDVEQALADRVAQTSPQLLDIHGCGVVSAATLIARGGPADRFTTADQFARYAGTAPIPAGSGQTARLTADHGGDRQINSALHRIAITQATNYPPAMAYVERKRAEGKTRRQAIRSLKRHIARRVWRTMVTGQDSEATRILDRMAELKPVIAEYEQLQEPRAASATRSVSRYRERTRSRGLSSRPTLTTDPPPPDFAPRDKGPWGRRPAPCRSPEP